MASPAALPVVDAPFSHSTPTPSPCGDWNSPRPEIFRMKDASKRKRVNRNAKLRQCKLDARREQWLSQVTGKNGKAVQEPHSEGSHAEKNKDSPGEVVHPDDHLLSATVAGTKPKLLCLDASERMDSPSRSHLWSQSPDNCEIGDPKHNFLSNSRDPSVSTAKIYLSDCCEADSSPKSCDDKSPKSKVTRLGGDFAGGRGRSSSNVEKECSMAGGKREEGTENGNPARSSGASYRNGVDALELEDDWEAAADALDLHLPPEKVSSTSRSPLPEVEEEESGRLGLQRVTACTPELSSKPDFSKKPILQKGISLSANGRAWRLDDTSRPASLPSLNKQSRLPAYSASQQRWSPHKITRDSAPVPLQCPICTEELDSTDSSFNPCPCGFRLCLFCHHRIASEDGRCPGCRKFYNNDLSAPKPASFAGGHSIV